MPRGQGKVALAIQQTSSKRTSGPANRAGKTQRAARLPKAELGGGVSARTYTFRRKRRAGKPVIFDHVRKSEELLHNIRWGKPMQEAAQEQYQEHVRNEFQKKMEAEAAARTVSNIKKVLHINALIHEQEAEGDGEDSVNSGSQLNSILSKSPREKLVLHAVPGANNAGTTDKGARMQRFSMTVDLQPPHQDKVNGSVPTSKGQQNTSNVDKKSSVGSISIPENSQVGARNITLRKDAEATGKSSQKEDGFATYKTKKSRNINLAESLNKMLPATMDAENQKMAAATQNLAKLMLGQHGMNSYQGSGTSARIKSKYSEEDEEPATIGDIKSLMASAEALDSKVSNSTRQASLKRRFKGVAKLSGKLASSQTHLRRQAEQELEAQRRMTEKKQQRIFQKNLSRRLQISEDDIKERGVSGDNSASLETTFRDRRRLQRKLNMSIQMSRLVVGSLNDDSRQQLKALKQRKEEIQRNVSTVSEVSGLTAETAAHLAKVRPRVSAVNAINSKDSKPDTDGKLTVDSPNATATISTVKKARKKNARLVRQRHQQKNEYTKGTEIYYGSTICLQARHGGYLCFDTRRKCKASSTAPQSNSLFTIWNLKDLSSNGIVKYGDSVWLQSGQHEVLATSVIKKSVPFQALTPAVMKSTSNMSEDGTEVVEGEHDSPFFQKKTDSRIPVAANFRGVNKHKAKSTARWTIHAKNNSQKMLDKEVCHMEEVVVMQEWAYLSSSGPSETSLAGRPVFSLQKQKDLDLSTTSAAAPGFTEDFTVHRDGVWVIKLVELPLEAQKKENQRYKLDYQARKQLQDSEKERNEHFTMLVSDIRDDKEDMLAEHNELAEKEERVRMLHLQKSFSKKYTHHSKIGFVKKDFSAEEMAQIYGATSTWGQTIQDARHNKEVKERCETKIDPRSIPKLQEAKTEYEAAALASRVHMNVWSMMEAAGSAERMAELMRAWRAANIIKKAMKNFLQHKWKNKFLKTDQMVNEQMEKSLQKAAEQEQRVKEARRELSEKRAETHTQLKVKVRDRPSLSIGIRGSRSSVSTRGFLNKTPSNAPSTRGLRSIDGTKVHAHFNSPSGGPTPKSKRDDYFGPYPDEITLPSGIVKTPKTAHTKLSGFSTGYVTTVEVPSLYDMQNVNSNSNSPTDQLSRSMPTLRRRPQSTSSFIEKSQALKKDDKLRGKVIRPQSAYERNSKNIRNISQSFMFQFEKPPRRVTMDSTPGKLESLSKSRPHTATSLSNSSAFETRTRPHSSDGIKQKSHTSGVRGIRQLKENSNKKGPISVQRIIKENNFCHVDNDDDLPVSKTGLGRAIPIVKKSQKLKSASNQEDDHQENSKVGIPRKKYPPQISTIDESGNYIIKKSPPLAFQQKSKILSYPIEELDVMPEDLNDAERLSLLQCIKPEVFGDYKSLRHSK